MTRQKPPSYAREQNKQSTRRRAVFSKHYQSLESHHVPPVGEDENPTASRRPGSAGSSARRNYDSMQLIDDLINHPYDALYSDARLGARKATGWRFWSTRIVVCIICIAVGFVACQFVRQLNTDPRKEVRQSLASQLQSNYDSIHELDKQNEKLRSEIDQQNNSLGLTDVQRQLQKDDLAAGTVPVKGPGITFTIANPFQASNSGTKTPADGSAHIKVITDLDLQQLVSLMWQGGAEAIAINGNRLGVQTSIRAASGSILIGTTPVQSPYVIQAIGNTNALAEWMGQRNLAQLYKDYDQAGIHPQISKEREMTLSAASAGAIVYAKEE
ncbi:protein ylxX/ylxW [Bifidobacterium dolichotidis]|uniref:Protein ylxX/ylxW n=1 Tax=Bifidobacterium dolichotidis TaxID=2306976 RepID=A0A430FT74_9BIFI|nr:DUF881 domain-containing protein [Bifidobacterium dolichotidis]RSX56069.1 protein ylxX/ylxW [Bifidobacterium dolichotidis]